MQRTTSALTAAVLGAALTASLAVAQQATAPGDASSSGASSVKASPSTSTEAADSQVYGMSVTRGARYLLRNGLDYLSYQQYDRALKFLREAEARINEQKARTDQKGRKVALELNSAELTALRQGIEAAQRGLRRATNAESPYALSDKSRPGNGFTPATSSTRLATQGYRTGTPAHNSLKTSPAPSSALASDGDDEQGQPVRLASGEIPVQNQPAGSNLAARPLTSNHDPVPALTDSDGPVSTPEMPPIPMVSRLPDLTAVNGAEPLVTTNDPNTTKSQLLEKTTNTPVSSGSELPISRETSPGAPQTLDIPLPAPTAEAEALKKPAVRDPGPGLPISDGTATALGTTSVAPATSTSPTPVASDDELSQPTPPSSPRVANTEKTTIDPETLPSSATDQAASQLLNPGGAAHQEHSDPAPPSSLDSAPVAPPPSPNTTVQPLGAPPSANEDLPALPADLSRPMTEVAVTDSPKTQPPTAAPPTTAPSPDDSLPPLPANLGRSTPLPDDSVSSLPTNPGQSASFTTDNAPTTAPVSDGAQASATAPLASTTLPQPAPMNDQAVTLPINGPATTQPSDGTIAQPGNQTPLVSPATEGTPAPKSVESAVPVASPGATQPTSTASLTATAAIPDSTTTELPQLPNSGADSSSETNATLPVNPASPVQSTDPESLPAAAPPERSETQPDASSLPPALTDGILSPGSDGLVPNRRNAPSSLKPELQREVERIARRQEAETERRTQTPTQPASPPRDTIASDLRTQTQMDISRAPSPAEARPIKAIPVPEDWVPLEPRNWTPQRKYWAAAATCHLPLYFQDPVLERYGHSVEQFVGPLGRFLTYPVDDPKQSTQRNQMLQPFFSAGLMGLQIIAWPYNLVMDPPWEAQYDLGYYRPGDNIPTDTYWLPLHGYGPPLRGSNY